MFVAKGVVFSMNVKSYIVTPCATQFELLVESLGSLPECDVLAADSHEVAILTTDFSSWEIEEDVMNKIHELACLQSITMVYGELGSGSSK
jgi:nitrate reductase NapAB chaperone NapD